MGEGAGSLPAVAVEDHILAVVCLQGGAACREGTAEIPRTVGVVAVVHPETESPLELQAEPEWSPSRVK